MKDFGLMFVLTALRSVWSREDFVCPQKNGLFADVESCRAFYQCDDGISFLKTCPPGTLFDGRRRDCVNRFERVVCGPQSTTTPPTTTKDPNKASPCDVELCKLPNCFCSPDGTAIPGNLPKNQVPQMILMTLDGAINNLNYEIYNSIFLENRTNPNGCLIKGTFFVSHEYSDYYMVEDYYGKGHEIATGSVTRRAGLENADRNIWIGEMVSMREILSNFADVRKEDVFGMRAPNLKPGRNTQFEMLRDHGWAWDSTIGVPPLKVPVWPYTLDYLIPHKCDSESCPTSSFPGVWEIPMNSHYKDEEYEGGFCPYLDRCVLHYLDAASALDWLKKDFGRHYNTNKAPYMLSLTTNWFQTDVLYSALLAFIDYTLTLPDVYYVTATDALLWMTAPTPLNELNTFVDWDCKRVTPPRCRNPTSCRLNLDQNAESLTGLGGTRYMSTCSQCPRTYPWVYDAAGTGTGKDNYATEF